MRLSGRVREAYYHTERMAETKIKKEEEEKEEEEEVREYGKRRQHTYPLASDCQYGANNPENAGTKYTSEVSPTCLAIASTMSEK